MYEPPDPEETPKGVALAALKEIEFDRETGKLSDEDYAFLKGKYTGAPRLAGARAAEAPDDIEAMSLPGSEPFAPLRPRHRRARRSAPPAARVRSRTRCSAPDAACGWPLPGGASAAAPRWAPAAGSASDAAAGVAA